MSSTIHLAALNSTQRNALQREFDDRIMYSIQPGATPYTGAEATRRILNSDNPLGLPSRDNRGLDAINRALSSVETKSILEDPQFAIDFGIDTSGNSQYSRLSNAGKLYVAEQVLAGRRTIYSTPSAVKAAFDRAVQARLQAETTLLGQINRSADYAALRRIIETAANSAILEFQTGAEPYRSFTNAQKNAMADYLWRLRQYRSIQEVIDAIRDYLGDPANAPGGGDGSLDISDLVIRRVTASVRGTTTLAQGNVREVTVSVETTTRTLTPQEVGSLITGGIISFQWTSGSLNAAQGTMARVFLPGATGVQATGPNVFTVRCTSSTPGTRDGLRFTLTDATGRQFNSSTITFSVEQTRPVTGMTIPSSPMRMLVGAEEQVIVTVTPSNSNETIIWESSDPGIAEVVKVDERSAMVIARSRGHAVIRAMTEDLRMYSNTRDVWVFRDEGDIIISPSTVTLGEGSTYQIRYEMYRPPVPGGTTAVDFRSANAIKASVTSTGLIRALNGSAASIPDSEDLPQPNRTVIIAEVRIGGVLRGSATVTVIIENRRSLLIGVEHAIMHQGEQQSLNVTREVDPATGLPILPYLPGQVFIWEIAGTSLEFVVNGQVTSAREVTLNPTVLPQIRASGIGRSVISIKTSQGEQPIHTVEVVSVPRGVEGMRFYNGAVNATNEISNREGYGRVLEIRNNESPQINATEQGDTGRLMTWTTLEVDQFRNTHKLPRTHSLYNTWYDPDGAAIIPTSGPLLGGFDNGYLAYQNMLNTNSGALREINSALILAPNGRITPQNNKTGLAAVRVSPVRDPDTERDVIPGVGTFLWVDYWYGTVPLFVSAGPGAVRINPIITEQSHLILEARPDVTLQSWSRVIGTVTEYFCGIILEAPPGTDTTSGFEASLIAILGAAVPPVPLPPGYDPPVHDITVTLANIEALIRAGYVRVTDANGILLTSTARPNPEIRAVVDSASYDESNMFYVWVSPRDVQILEGGRSDTVIPWENRWMDNPAYASDPSLPQYIPRPSTGADAIIPFDFTLTARVVQGSNDIRNNDNIWWDWPRDPLAPPVPLVPTPVPGAGVIGSGVPAGAVYHPPDNMYEYYIVTNSEQYNDRSFMTLRPQTLSLLGGGNAGIGIQGVQRYGQEYSAFANARIIAAGTYILGVRVVQQGNFGFAPIDPQSGDNVGRKPPRESTADLSVTFTITQQSPPITGAMIGLSAPISLFEGFSAAMDSIDVDPAGASYESLTPGTLTITENGVATGVSEGVALVEATDGETTGTILIIVGPSATMQTPPAAPDPEPPATEPPSTEPSSTEPQTTAPPAHTENAPTAVRLRSTAGVAVGGTMRLEPFVTPYNANRSALRWSSSNETIATVSEGTVTGLRAGTVTITVTGVGGNITATCSVTVRNNARPVTSIRINRTTLNLNAGSASTLSVTYRPTNASIRGVTWVSNNSSVARVEPGGRVVGISAGTAVITAISDSGALTASCTVTVVVPVASVTLPERRITLRIGETYQLEPIIYPDDATNTNATYSSRTPAIASVTSAGLVTASRAGTTTITVRVGSKTVTCTVVVTR